MMSLMMRLMMRLLRSPLPVALSFVLTLLSVPVAGTVKLHDANGTVADTSITFGPAVKSAGTIQRNISATFSGKTDEKLNGRCE